MPSAGLLDLSFARRGKATVITRRLYTWPHTVGRVFYDHRAAAGAATVVVQSGSGSVIDGDRLHQVLHAGCGAQVRVVGQGAVSVQRAGEARGATEESRLEVGAGAWLENVPQPRVLFPGADFTQRVEIDVRGTGIALSVDAFVLHADNTEPQRYRCETSVARDGVMVARDRALLVSPPDGASFGWLRAHAVVLLAGTGCDTERAPEGWRRWTQEVGSQKAYGAVSALPNDAGLVVRIAAVDGRLLRAAVASALPLLRASAPQYHGEVPARQVVGTLDRENDF